MRQREAAQTLHELVVCAGERPVAQRQARLREGLLEWARGREEDQLTIPRSKCQKVAKGNRALRGHRVLERALDCSQDPSVLEFRQPVVHRVVEPDLAFLYQG